MPRDYEPIETEDTPRRSLIRVLIIAGVAFLGGVIGMGWFLVNYGPSLGIFSAEETEATSPESSAAVAALERQLDDTEPGEPGAPVGETPDTAEIEADRATLARRVAQLEDRIDRIGTRAGAAAGNADRAEGLLVAFAARRALDRGVALGYIEGLLRERFGRSAPEAVARVIAASQQPVTLDGLQSRLTALEPELIGIGEGESWWDATRREFSELFVLRQEGTPSPAPRQRLQRARDKLAVGQVDTALAEVLRLPEREAAEQWIADARRYIAARNALDRIETIALMEPRLAARQREQDEANAAAEAE
ncbi:hypothetical protein HFP51_11470 [Parasphingopyxis sp. CP4]|uniref:hypothetical protein n=1 Tax=Parasphingopyxis sp. CP4 TaxID=2724527 RepID=UPI0015A13C9B|nr:hypothetical protein [Parasphingopyxis sp. CP4]QLC22742.1 hypothetical protein HFP51_11470 [Parasphingopyxis sp. CP4]